MVAAANSGRGPAVSHHIQSPEGSGGARQAKGAKKSALGVFARLLAGLTRKTKAGETGTEAPAGKGQTPEGVKTASGKKTGARNGEIPLPANEKNRHRDRRFLTALRDGGETPDSAPREGSAKKTKPMDPPEEGAAIPAGVFPGAAPADPAPEGLNNEPGPSEQDGLFRLAEGGRVPDAAGDKRILPETRAGAADPGASGEAPAEAASASSRRARGAAWEEPGPVKKDRAGSAETRNSRKNRERFVLEVRDLRTEGPVPGQEPGAGLESGEERVVDLVAELRDRGGNQEPEQPGQAKTAGRAFEDILARELHQNLNGDIVRQASILVKDGGEGTVRLSLKPESLGMVKVRLEMAENKITGRIIVESNEALRAFEREIHSLEQAFRDSGFAGASLEMALAGDGGHNSRGQRDGDGPFLSAWRVSSSYDGMAEAADVFMMEAGFDGFAGPGASRVNMLA